MALWTGCVAGALEEREFIALLTEAGFENASIEPTRVYTREDAAALLRARAWTRRSPTQVEGKIMSGFVRATKPGPRAPSVAHAPDRSASERRAPNATRDCGCDDGC